jgi:hypothetical protein
MPRTAPTVNGTPTYVVVSLRMIDANGQLDSIPYRTTLARATNAAVEAVVAKQAAASNGNVYDCVIELHYAASTVSPASAVEAPRESIKDAIVTLEKDVASGASQESLILAPLDALFLDGSNDVDTTATAYTEYNTAVDALLPTTYAPISVRFSERKGTNSKTRL